MRPLGRTVIGSGVIGFVLGVVYVDLQWAAEHAQVLARLVSYPPGDPIGIVQAGPWSVVSQLAAAGLRVGLPERWLCWLLSGFLGAVSCQAIATTAFAITRHEFFSLGVLFVTIVSRAFDWGASYQISLYGSAHTYGVAGLSLGVLALALAGAGAWRTGVFLAVLLVGIQTPSGIFVAAVFAGAWALEAAFDWRQGRTRARQAVLPLALAGLALAISLAVFMALTHGLPSVAERGPTIDAFFRYWDAHRQPLGWTAGPVRIVWGLGVVALVWLAALRAELSVPRWWFLGATGFAALLGLVSVGATRIPWESQPLWLAALMPGRFLNFSLMMAGPALLSLAFTLPGRAGVVNPLVFAALLLFSRRSLLWSAISDIPHGSSTIGVDQLSALGAMGLALMIQAIVFRKSMRERPSSGRSAGALSGVLHVPFVAALAITSILGAREPRARGHVWRDRTNDPIFEAASGARRILMGGDAWLIQLRTRSPLVLDAGTLDVLPYQPAAVAAMERILRDLYGTDLLKPPAAMRPEGRVPPTIYRELWERRSRPDWSRLAGDFGFDRVVTDGDWQLDLRLIAEGHGLRVFAIDRP